MYSNIDMNSYETSPMKRPIQSPLLFSDCEESPQKKRIILQSDPKLIRTTNSLKRKLEVNVIAENESKLVKRVRDSLSSSGVLALDFENWTAEQFLDKIHANNHLFIKDSPSTKKISPNTKISNSLLSQVYNKSSLLVVHDVEEARNCDWPEVSQMRTHGIYYNRSNLSEIFEVGCYRIAEKFVKNETFSTFGAYLNEDLSTLTSLPKTTSSKSTKEIHENLSPEKRISQLIRRKITFKKDDLKNLFIKNKLRSRTILLDEKTYRATVGLLQSNNNQVESTPKDNIVAKRTLFSAVINLLDKYDVTNSNSNYKKYVENLFKITKYTMLAAKCRDFSYDNCTKMATRFVIDVIIGQKTVDEMLKKNPTETTEDCLQKAANVLKEIEVNVEENQQKIKLANNEIQNLRDKVKRKINFDQSESNAVAQNIQNLVKSYQINDC